MNTFLNVSDPVDHAAEYEAMKRPYGIPIEPSGDA